MPGTRHAADASKAATTAAYLLHNRWQHKISWLLDFVHH
jgi:hypothetical protein